mmetsp:Transcript_42642/g.89191  ORF Transcript_42642/g.89191 Transcript_42642/m.89191 type:complete len:200 (+) Transcript_42642:970-1569(+)
MSSSLPTGSMVKSCWVTRNFPHMHRTLLSVPRRLQLSLTGPPLAKAFIDAHTAVRALHGAPPLTWDNALADSSLKYASGCVKGHATDLPADVGENLYYTASSAKINLDDPALVKSAVDKWYSEEANWDYAASAGKGTGSTGHFTQTVWKSTAKVGCGIASCPNILIGGKTWADVGYVICRYTPSGNWDGEYATNVPKKK